MKALWIEVQAINMKYQARHLTSKSAFWPQYRGAVMLIERVLKAERDIALVKLTRSFRAAEKLARQYNKLA